MAYGGGPADTICAIATPVGEGGVGIVRLSGMDSIPLAARFIRLRSGDPLDSLSTHSLHLADIVRSQPSSHSSQTCTDYDVVIDEAFVVFMKAPRSYTGEDVVEIHCHGNRRICAMICDTALSAGCRLAQPGEFTRRAFLNGKMDLSQAEAVLDTIKATSEAGLKVAQRHLRGDLGKEVGCLRERLLTLLAHIEAGIDFVEEDISFVERAELLDALAQTQSFITQVLHTAKTGRLLREGARVVIAGRPNVGKSSLLNALLREQRAIVSAIPGTTRDMIEESMEVDGIRLSLIDTAGIRSTVDPIEQEGIHRTWNALQDADVIIILFDASSLPEDAVEMEAYFPLQERAIPVLNKVDLLVPEQRTSLQKRLSDICGHPAMCISTITGEGLDVLRHHLRSRILPDHLEASDGVMITNVRHQAALGRAHEALTQAIDAIASGRELECLAVDLRTAADALGEITGVITSDEILDRIFSEFCIGK